MCYFSINMYHVRDERFKSHHLSGILIDSFVFAAIGFWHWLRENEQSGKNEKAYEQVLLDYYKNNYPNASYIAPNIYAPGSGMKVGVDDWDVLGKVLNKMV